MKQALYVLSCAALGLGAVLWNLQQHPATAGTVSDDPAESGFYAAASDLTPSVQAGREIWYKATGGNGRFHTYVYQQRIGVWIDWFRVLRSDRRAERFKIWGLMNDPGCCTPGSDGCPAQSYEDTYGFDYCPGDEELLNFVGEAGYRDPACDMQHADVLSASFPTVHAADQRQSSCDLAFGTSTGAMGLRKFPNPRFDAQKWRELNDGDLGTWEGYGRLFTKDNGDPEIDALGYEVRQLEDASIEPPFHIGMACGACHIAFDPLNPPENPAAPQWQNLLGLIGNQYTRMSEIMASGMPENTLEWQMFSHSRPGTVDTSAVPNDQVNNPGTMNALINLAQRPAHFEHDVLKWRDVTSCTADRLADGTCWCEPERDEKCWLHSNEREPVHQILKGGEDSIGLPEAVQRVYINIGSCSEQCWVNHLTDLRQLDPYQRNYGQTPMDIGQCRRDCPNFRAIEDRLGNIADYLLSTKAQSTPLFRARGLDSRSDLIEQLENEFGASVTRGKEIFADNCARCHSFVPEPEPKEGAPHFNVVADAATFKSADPYAMDAASGRRANWIGNDEITPASEVGTYRCRSLHSNHVEGHVWQEYGSETYRGRPAEQNLGDPADGGRGSYRNISLVDSWAHAPFMHNNAMGPEICGKPGTTHWEGQRIDFYSSPYVAYTDQNNNGQLDDNEQFTPLTDPPKCWAYDPSVEGRFKLFKASVDSLLNAAERTPKVTMLNQDVVLDIGPKVQDDDNPRRLVNVRVMLPRGTSAGMFGSFQHKKLFSALVQSRTEPERLKENLRAGPRPESVDEDAQLLADLRNNVLRNPGQIYNLAKEVGDTLLQLYSTCTAKAENNGHDFGQALSPKDKDALTAFLATL